MKRKINIKGITMVRCLMAVVTLTGCGSKNENVEKGMQQIAELNYQAALDCFDAAQKASENARLISRGRGIAYMGLTDYEHGGMLSDSFARK